MQKRHTKPRRGYALVTVLIFLAIMLMFVSISQRYIGSILMIESAQLEADRVDDGPGEALALGIALLETGLPPSDPYACRVTVPTDEGPRTFRVDFANPAWKQWTVDVGPLGIADTLPEMPLSFNDNF